MGIIRISSSPEVHTMYLKRKVDAFLCAWKADPERKPLIIKGCRQVGKTESVKQFAEKNYESVIEINFIRDEKYKGILADGYEASAIIKNISLIDPSKKFIPNKTLLFFDEITEFPEIATALKFFFLDGRFDVICSGSMLGVNYRKIESNSVGYKTDYEMFSMDFEEFLWAKGYNENTLELLKKYYDSKERIPEEIHNQFMRLIREYIVVGGMPAVVQTYLDSNHFGQVQKVQEQIISSYMDDISKYASSSEKPKVKNCYMSVTKQLAKENKKFQFSVVESKATARKFENSIEWLRDAGLVWLCKNVSACQFPLVGYENDKFYKMYLTDLGLLVAMYGFEMKQAILDDTLTGPVKGGIYENLIADILMKSRHSLHYYQNKNLEIEFLIEQNTKVIPVEVKAGNNRSQSMDQLLKNENIPYGYKFVNGNCGINGKKITLPLYLAMYVD